MPGNSALGFEPVFYSLAVRLPESALFVWCDRWQVQELYLFGSILTDKFHEDSDIDVMVQFSPDAQWGFELAAMKLELERIFTRSVDLLTKASVEESHNWLRRESILNTAKLVYARGQRIAS